MSSWVAARIYDIITQINWWNHIRLEVGVLSTILSAEAASM